MYVCVSMEGEWKNVQVHWVRIDVKSFRERPDEGGKKSVMDAQLHTDINTDDVNPHLKCTIYIFCLGEFKCIKYTICFAWPSSQTGHHKFTDAK